MTRTKTLLLFLSLLWSLSLTAQVEPILVYKDKHNPQCTAWVDSVMKRMSLKEKAAQLFIYTIAPNPSKANLQLLEKAVRQHKVGGLLFSGGELMNQARLTNKAQEWAKIPLLITFDGEWGLAMRLKNTPLFPRNEVLGNIRDNSLIYEYGREVARECRELGIHVNFAPDADVNTNPQNPVIGSRSFGKRPEEVADKVLAYSFGLESYKVLSVAKHFPGHGDTHVDSHKGLPKLDFGKGRLDSVELVPFKEYIRAGLGGVMVGHLEVPAIEPEPGIPSSLSRKVVQGLLQEELQFKGLIFTDALAMKGAASKSSVCVRALKAGHDLLLVPPTLKVELEAVLNAIEQGELDKQDIERRCRKVLTYKYALGLSKRPEIQLSGLEERINTPEAKDLIERLKEAAALDAKREKKRTKVFSEIDSTDLARIDGIALEGIRMKAYPGCQIVVMKEGEVVYNKCFGTYTPSSDKRVTNASIYDIASLSKTTGTLLAVMKLYDRGLFNLSDKVAMYVPELRKSSTRDISIRDLLYHQSGLPSSIIVYPNVIDKNSYTGRLFSKRRDGEHSEQVGERTWARKDFQFKKGFISDEPGGDFELHVDKQMWANRFVKDTLLASATNKPILRKTYRYSCVGFILLQQLVERLSNMPLDQFLAKEFYKPMRLEHTLYKPLQQFPREQIVPTSDDSFLRRGMIQGYVHDETAAFLGGVAGNAGLFSTAEEVATIHQMLLNGGEWQGKRYLSAATCRLFTETRASISRRGLGFDRPNPKDAKHAPCSPSTPLSTYGHTGFTGTCAWIDPDNQLVYVFLSNRVCPHSWNRRLMSLKTREHIQETVYQALRTPNDKK